LTDEGAVVRLLGVRLGTVDAADGDTLEVDATLENSPSVLFDAVVLPDGEVAASALLADGQTVEFIQNQFRHGKTILAVGAGRTLLPAAGIKDAKRDVERDPGLILADSGDMDAKAFIKAVARHRHPERDRDPPKV
jgi:catalase